MYGIDARTDFINGKLLNDPLGQLWLFSNKKLYLLGKNQNKLAIREFSLNDNDRKNVSGFEHINPLEKDQYLIGTNKGYLTVSLNKLKKTIGTIDFTSIAADNKEKTIQLSLKKKPIYPASSITLIFVLQALILIVMGKHVINTYLKEKTKNGVNGQKTPR